MKALIIAITIYIHWANLALGFDFFKSFMDVDNTNPPGLMKYIGGKDCLYQDDKTGKLIPHKECRDQMEFDVDKGTFLFKDNSYELSLKKDIGGEKATSRIIEWSPVPNPHFIKTLGSYQSGILKGATTVLDKDGYLLSRTECEMYQDKAIQTRDKGCATITPKRCVIAKQIAYNMEGKEKISKECMYLLKDISRFTEEDTDIDVMKADQEVLNAKPFKIDIKKFLSEEDPKTDHVDRKTFFYQLYIGMKMLKDTMDLCDKYGAYFRSDKSPLPTPTQKPPTVQGK